MCFKLDYFDYLFRRETEFVKREENYKNQVITVEKVLDLEKQTMQHQVII